MVQLEAQGLGDIAPVSAAFRVEALALKPLAPVHGRAERNLIGSLDLAWKRRSRLDFGWVDGVDQAQIEEQESYRVALCRGNLIVREWVVAENALHISAPEFAAAGMPQNADLHVDIRQIGRFTQSDPLTVGIP